MEASGQEPTAAPKLATAKAVGRPTVPPGLVTVTMGDVAKVVPQRLSQVLGATGKAVVVALIEAAPLLEAPLPSTSAGAPGPTGLPAGTAYVPPAPDALPLTPTRASNLLPVTFHDGGPGTRRRPSLAPEAAKLALRTARAAPLVAATKIRPTKRPRHRPVQALGHGTAYAEEHVPDTPRTALPALRPRRTEAPSSVSPSTVDGLRRVP